MNEDVQYESGTSSVQVRMCSTSKVTLVQVAVRKKIRVKDNMSTRVFTSPLSLLDFTAFVSKY